MQMRLSCQNSGSMWLCPGVVHKLKEHSLSAKTQGQNVKRFITWLLALVSVDICCKVTAPEALSSQTWLLILQWELDSMSNTSGGGLRQCPGTGRHEKLVCKAGIDKCLSEHLWSSSQAQPTYEVLQWQLQSL